MTITLRYDISKVSLNDSQMDYVVSALSDRIGISKEEIKEHAFMKWLTAFWKAPPQISVDLEDDEMISELSEVVLDEQYEKEIVYTVSTTRVEKQFYRTEFLEFINRIKKIQYSCLKN